MKKNKPFLLFAFAVSTFNYALSQAPLVKMWDRDYGGVNGDGLFSFQETTDKGFILGGCSWSDIGGDKSQPLHGGFGDLDFWIIKTDSAGLLTWERAYGGSEMDWLTSIQQTTDGGYILGGYSMSGANGDKSDPNRDPTANTFDYWIIKVDSLGVKQWDQTFGGTDDDFLTSLQQTSDGGYILGGYSGSNIGADKTLPLAGTQGYDDYWVIKTDSAGNKLWEKDFGGIIEDALFCIRQTTDGGYIMGGHSDSPVGADKTQASWGARDYWVIKTDSSGNFLWDKDFGGTMNDELYSLMQTSDHGYLLGGISKSGLTGDKTEPSFGLFDYWILKLDSTGNKIWDKTFGGNESESQFGNVYETSDGYYAVAGKSSSDASGNKTQNNLSPEQTWVVKMDSLGNMIWDRTLLINAKVEYGYITEASDGCFVVADYNTGNTGGDKSQNTWGENDYWIVKLCESYEANFTVTSQLCPGACTSFINLSSGMTTYEWSFPGANPSSSTSVNPVNICYPNPGSYDVQLIASNNLGSDTLLIPNCVTVFPFPPAQAITQVGDTLYAIPGATSYQWYFNTILIPGATNYFYLATSNGNYNVVATDNNGCEVEAAIFDVVLSVEPPDGGWQLEIFPNPAGDELTVESSVPDSYRERVTAGSIAVYNLLGEKMAVQLHPDSHRTTNSELRTFDVSQLPPGIYYFEVAAGEKLFRAKFVKQ